MIVPLSLHNTSMMSSNFLINANLSGKKEKYDNVVLIFMYIITIEVHIFSSIEGSSHSFLWTIYSHLLFIFLLCYWYFSYWIGGTLYILGQLTNHLWLNYKCFPRSSYVFDFAEWVFHQCRPYIVIVVIKVNVSVF